VVPTTNELTRADVRGGWRGDAGDAGVSKGEAQAREREGRAGAAFLGTILPVLCSSTAREPSLGRACGLGWLGPGLEGKERAQGGVWGTRVGPKGDAPDGAMFSIWLGHDGKEREWVLS
jgi:hypothetical protein